MNPTNRPAFALFLSVCTLAGIGCGAGVDHAVVHPAMMTDGDRYAAALDEATDRYAAEIEQALQFTYPSPEEAQAAALALSPQRYDQLLERALARRGLTTHGLRVHASRHEEFVDIPAVAETRTRLATLRERAVTVAHRYPAEDSVAMSLLTDEPAETLARR